MSFGNMGFCGIGNVTRSVRSSARKWMPYGRPVISFDEIQLISPLQRALSDEGYEVPTPIQAETIPPALEGLDVLGCAQTGTGKTAAFALPILDHLARGRFRPVARRPLGLILAPTRELAVQIGDSFDAYGRHLSIEHALIYGGVGQGRQVQALERGVHVLIATPGRLLDLMGQEHIFLNRLQVFVLDEADRMLDMGFLPDLKKIIRALPIRRQSMFFSATMPPRIRRLSEKLLHDPVRVQVAPETTNVDLIDQRIIFADHRQKKPLLVRLITAGDVGQAIVFTKTKRGANAVADYLRRHDVETAVIHGNKSQNARQTAMAAFRSDKAQVLVATDLAARGIDVEGISHVFNFELPLEPEQYVHRIGRTGRAGATGVAISLCSADERTQLQSIERLIGFEILEDGRQPEPTERVRHSADAKNAKAAAKDGASGPASSGGSSNRRRRRRRGRGSRAKNGATATSTDANESPAAEPKRPTAAQRKAARNRRRRKRSSDDDESR